VKVPGISALDFHLRICQPLSKN